MSPQGAVGFVLYESMLRDERRRASAMQEEFSRRRRRVLELEADNRALAAENRRLQTRLAKRRKAKGQASGPV